MSEFEIAIALFDFIKTFELNAEQQAYFDTLRKAWNNLQDGGEENMSECERSNCGYFWKDEDDDYPRCHFDGIGKAPCEEDDWDE